MQIIICIPLIIFYNGLSFIFTAKITGHIILIELLKSLCGNSYEGQGWSLKYEEKHFYELKFSAVFHLFLYDHLAKLNEHYCSFL